MSINKELFTYASIVIVDDTPENLKVLSGMLKEKGYEIRPVLNGKQALQVIHNKPPDLILLDINMPNMNGYEVCETLKKEDAFKNIPIIFISALSESLDKVRAFSVGGVDYITKPFQLEEVNARVETHLRLSRLMNNLESLVEQKVKEISDSQTATILAMARLAQSRDDSTGTHLERVSGYCQLIAKGLANLPQYQELINVHFIDLIQAASSLHDIGKVGIPDSILLKEGKLTSEEYEIMKLHSTIGSKTLEDVYRYYPQNEFVKMGIEIARWHHEKWDGSGYPDQLVGEAIPLTARIMALADVYDALKSERCYKKALSHDACVKIISQDGGKYFDPVIVEIFRSCHEEIHLNWKKYHPEL